MIDEELIICWSEWLDLCRSQWWSTI